MPDFEAMAQYTCSEMLSATHLKAICRYRGFIGDGKKSKAALTSFVAPRLVGTEGVRNAIASLDAKWLAALHRIAFSSGSTTVSDLFPIVFPGTSFYTMPTQSFFKRIADELLSRGVVLVEDRPLIASYGNSRYEKLVFHLAPDHYELLPDYPISTRGMPAPLSSDSSTTVFERFFRDMLEVAVCRASSGKPDTSKDIVDLFAAELSIGEGEIRYKNQKICDITTCYRRILKDWEEGRGIKKEQKRSPEAFTAIRHILGHLPPKQGVDTGVLEKALAAMGVPAGKEGITQFCDLGCKIGVLEKALSGGSPLYRGHGQSNGLPEFEDGELVFKTDDAGIIVNIGESSAARLLALASLCHVQVKNGALHLSPSVPLMGSFAETLDAHSAIEQVRRVSKPFDAAVRDIHSRQSSLFVHQGLQVMRVTDLGLRTLLLHRFADDIRPLEGAYLVALRSSMPAIEKTIRGEGFSPRLEK